MPFDGDFSAHPETGASAPEFEPSAGSARGGVLHAWVWLVRARHIALLRGLTPDQLAAVGLRPADLAWLTCDTRVQGGNSGWRELQTPNAGRSSEHTVAES